MAKLPYEVIFEDKQIVVVNKAPGLATIPTRDADEENLRDLLSLRFGSIWTVHRIDRDTSGIVIFARDDQTHKDLSAQFQDRLVTKHYHAIVRGVPSPAEGTIELSIEVGTRGKVRISSRGKPSTTSYQVIEEFKGYSLLSLQPLTGRQHQIRIHLAEIGHPLVLDPLYGSNKSFNIADVKRSGLNRSGEHLTPLLQRTPLHAFSLELDLGTRRYFEAPVPKDMRATLNQLRKWRKK